MTSLCAPLPEKALVIAADRGWDNALALGLSPDVLVGDMDSISAVPDGVELHRSPAVKDETDAQLAIRCAVSRGAALGRSVYASACGIQIFRTAFARQEHGERFLVQVSARTLRACPRQSVRDKQRDHGRRGIYRGLRGRRAPHRVGQACMKKRADFSRPHTPNSPDFVRGLRSVGKNAKNIRFFEKRG